MRNFISGAVLRDGSYNKLCVKTFIGTPAVVEKEIQKFLDSNPVEIKRTMQSESAGLEGFGIIITLFYYSEGKPQFIDERWTISLLTSKMLDELEGMYGITFDDVWDTMVKKQQLNSTKVEKEK